MDFFVKAELPPPPDAAPAAAPLEGDALVSAMRQAWNAAASPHVDPVQEGKITPHQQRYCEAYRSAAARLGMSAAPQWEVYLSERGPRLERKFDAEIMTGRFTAWMAERAAALNRSGV